MRHNFSAAFEAKVALEDLAGEATPAELSVRHKVHPTLITKWKRQAAVGMMHVFSGKAGGRDGAHEAETRDLHAKRPHSALAGQTWAEVYHGRAAGSREHAPDSLPATPAA